MVYPVRRTTARYEYTRIPKSYLYHVAAEEAKQKWQAEWITSYKAAATKLFSIRSGQTRNKTNTNHEASSRADRARENEGISLPLQTKGRREMYMRPERPNKGSSAVPLREDQHTARGLKHHISQQRNWMEIKQELISKHTKVFCEFIESIDFELLQQNEQ